MKLPKIKDVEKESMVGYVYAVSGPGKWQCCDFIISLYELFEDIFHFEWCSYFFNSAS